ncbi:FG-GAP-like repeat-containing protein [uncultured Winogradskyella sp.]|uniref:FG-GAP-like repeat-containing protein n=1 Tax=uncultured Winogradskyella sp. TaxID=395353 RepID=UPI00261486BF|nr:FG-GAP-like repeat-containing protein [uncultured Winogradskyella sp.]
MRKNYSLFCLLLFSVFLNGQSFERVESLVGLGILEDNNGVAVADYDGDNDLDIFVVAKAKDNLNNEKTVSRLFRNDNDGSFTDVTESAGFSNLYPSENNPEEFYGLSGFKYGAFWGDYNNDGFPDLFMTFLDSVQLWRNMGNGTFSNVTSISGITESNDCGNTGATWFDYNNDGFLDLFIADWRRCAGNSLYLNNGNETFTNVSVSAGITNSFIFHSFVGFPFDFDEDGLMDLYVTNDLNDPNHLYINQNGVDFVEQGLSYNVDTQGDDMAVAYGDYNLDGYIDIFVTAINVNFLLTNNGDNTFTENAVENGVGNTLWSWGAKFTDFDLDGDEDLFVVNGYPLDITGNGPENNYFFKNTFNEGQLGFEDISNNLNLDEYGISVEVIDFDYDNDGDIDFVVTNSDRGCFFYENKELNFDDTETTLNWFKIHLQGTTSNRDAIGTTLTLTTANGTLKRYYTGVGFLGQSLQAVHFGLDDATEVLTLEVQWPSGLVENYSNISSNTTVKLTEGSGIEVLNIEPSQKVYGCTDPVSCNYNPNATLNDGSCVYLPSQTIVGNTSSSFLSTETYTYNIDAGSTANWVVSGGELISGQGTNSITVKWHLEEFGSVAITETDDQCSSQEVVIDIELGVDDLPDNVSIARLWNEALLEAIRDDFARPTVHARNLFHTSVAMYDAWAIYDDTAVPYFIGNTVHGFTTVLEEFTPNEDIDTSISKAISYAMYRLMTHRFQNSPGLEETQARFDLLMGKLGYDINNTSLMYEDGDAAALGNFIAQSIIDYGLQDGSREATGYDNAYYEPANQAYALDDNNNPPIQYPNRWQPLGLDSFIDQGGNIIDSNVPPFLSPEWGNVYGFALSDADMVTYQRDGDNYQVFHDPSDPPYISLTEENAASDAYKWGFSMVSVWQSHLDQNDGVMWDISPNSIGNVDISTFPTSYTDYSSFYNFFDGGAIGDGYTINPITGNPYEVNMVPRGDYARVLAEFWADGPDSETPPGHWFSILNYVNDHPMFERRFEGQGDILDPIEWDVKAYFILGGGMHDAAVSAWGVKGWYDYIRPISAIRSMAKRGQSTDSSLDNYHVGGIELIDGYVEVVEAGDPLAGFANQHVGKIKLYTWRGHDYIGNTETDQAGVGWILADDWYPYQRPTFVTPPFAGYVSGHSTFSRTASELMTMMTGSEFFPGGLGEFTAKANEFLVFEEGPSVDVVLQWATYRDASDQTSLSRIWGGIHPPADDIPGRFIGQEVAGDTFDFAVPYFNGSLGVDDFDLNMHVYPNPVTNNEITITNTNGSETVEIYDVGGRKIQSYSSVYSIINNSTNIILRGFNIGVYVLKIVRDNKSFTKKILVL